MINETYFLRFKGEFYNNPKEDFITIFLANRNVKKPVLAYKIAKSAIIFYVPAKKSTDDEILITLSEDEYKALKMPKFKNIRMGVKGTENLPPRSPTVPPKIEFMVEGFVIR